MFCFGIPRIIGGKIGTLVRTLEHGNNIGTLAKSGNWSEHWARMRLSLRPDVEPADKGGQEGAVWLTIPIHPNNQSTTASSSASSSSSWQHPFVTRSDPAWSSRVLLGHGKLDTWGDQRQADESWGESLISFSLESVISPSFPGAWWAQVFLKIPHAVLTSSHFLRIH